MSDANITPLENMTNTQKTEIEAAAFRRLLKHLDDNKEVQNIDLMIQKIRNN